MIVIKYDCGLIRALVQRWRRETHTFHLPIGEATITLHDIGVLSGLPIDGAPVIGVELSRSAKNWAIIFYCRGGSSNGSSTVGERLLSTLLTEMDGLEEAKGILLLAATNRPHAIDAALMRPGRFDLVLYVPPPDLAARQEMLSVHTRGMKVGNDVNLRQIAEETELFTGAELEGLCREAGIVALREDIAATVVCNRHFQTVKRSLKPALSRELDSYSSFMNKTTRRSVDQSKSSAQQKNRCTTNFLASATPATIGVFSVIVLVGVKYFLTYD